MYKKDFKIHILIKSNDGEVFKKLQETILSKENAFWKDGSKEIIPVRENTFLLIVTQDKEKISLAYMVGDNAFSDSIILYPEEFLSFWENPEAFFPAFEEEEIFFLENLKGNRKTEDDSFLFYTLRTGLSLRQAKQALLFNKMAVFKETIAAIEKKNRELTNLLQKRIKERSPSL